MLKLTSFITTAGMAVLLSACSSTYSLDELLAANAAARGGSDAIESVDAAQYELVIEEPTFTLTGKYVATRSGLMRIDVYAGDQRVFTEALGPEGGWQMAQDGEIVILKEDLADILERGRIGNLYGLHELPGLGYKLQLHGKEKQDGSEYWKLEVISPSGFSRTVFIDAETDLVSHDMRTTALHPDIDPEQIPQVTYYSQYTDFGGVLISTRSLKKNLRNGDVMQTAKITSVRINPEIDHRVFEIPTED